MNLLKNLIIISAILFLSNSGFAQFEKILPISIYPIESKFEISDHSMNLNKNLNFRNLRFRSIDVEDVKSNLYSVSFYNIGRKATSYDLDSYKSLIFNETDKYYDPNRIAILPTYK